MADKKSQGEKFAYDCYWCACDWSGSAGPVWDICECEPCCGKPCNVANGAYCCLCWWFCAPCSLSKMWAYSVDQDCAILNHLCLTIFCGPCVAILTRHNLRRKELLGDTCEYWWGDVFCICCCTPCAMCQMCRAVKPEDWDWIHQAKEKGLPAMEDPCKFWLPD